VNSAKLLFRGLAYIVSISYDDTLHQLATLMLNLSNTSNLPQPAPMPSVISRRHDSNLEPQPGDGFALSARCAR
jgi:hypothetical protein